VFRSASIGAMNHEVELQFRFLDDADSVRGYELLLSKDGTIQCFRWDDSFGTFTEITLTGTANVGSVADGAEFKARIVGDALTVYFDGNQQCTGDIGSIAGTKYTTGNPAFGFFCRPSGEGANPEHFGFHSISVSRL